MSKIVKTDCRKIIRIVVISLFEKIDFLPILNYGLLHAVLQSFVTFHRSIFNLFDLLIKDLDQRSNGSSISTIISSEFLYKS